jgi:hypothetical protein
MSDDQPKPEKVDDKPWLYCRLGEHRKCANKAELQRGVMNVCPCDCHKQEVSDDKGTQP